MKKIIFLTVSLCFSVGLFAQDIIITKYNERIEAKVLEINKIDVKYELFDFKNDTYSDTVYLIYKSEVKLIVYQNGMVEYFDNDDKENVVDKSDVVTEQPDVVEQPQPAKVFRNVIRLNPFVTIYSAAALGAFDIDLHYAYYVSSKVAIPVEVEVYVGERFGNAGCAVLSGIEVVSAKYRPKSGFFADVLSGFVVAGGEVGFAANANIGYQFISSRGFAFNVAGGPKYDTITGKILPRLMINFGIAF